MNKRFKIKNGNMLRKKQKQQFGGGLDWLESIRNSWNGFTSDPFSNQSQGYLNNLLQRNSVAGLGTNKTYGDPNSPFYDPNFNQNVFEGQHNGSSTEGFTEWLNNSGYGTQMQPGSDEFERLEQMYQDEIGEQYEATNQAQYKDTFSTTDQIFETGAGIHSLMSSQAAYDAKQKPQRMNTSNNQGLKRYKTGGMLPVSNAGLYEYPDQPVVVPNGSITMKGIDQPVLALPNGDQPKIMQPGKNYNFANSTNVLEVPMKSYQSGGIVDDIAAVLRPHGAFGDRNNFARHSDPKKIPKEVRDFLSNNLITTRGIIPINKTIPVKKPPIQNVSGASNTSTPKSIKKFTPKSIKKFTPIGAGVGMSTDKVESFQKVLKDKGLYKGNIDGLWGKNTQAAFQSFNDSNTAVDFSTGSTNRNNKSNSNSKFKLPTDTGASDSYKLTVTDDYSNMTTEGRYSPEREALDAYNGERRFSSIKAGGEGALMTYFAGARHPAAIAAGGLAAATENAVFGTNYYNTVATGVGVGKGLNAGYKGLKGMVTKPKGTSLGGGLFAGTRAGLVTVGKNSKKQFVDGGKYLIDEAGAVYTKAGVKVKDATTAARNSVKNFFKKGKTKQTQEYEKLMDPKTSDILPGLTRASDGTIRKIQDTRGGLQKLTDLTGSAYNTLPSGTIPGLTMGAIPLSLITGKAVSDYTNKKKKKKSKFKTN